MRRGDAPGPRTSRRAGPRASPESGPWTSRRKPRRSASVSSICLTAGHRAAAGAGRWLTVAAAVAAGLVALAVIGPGRGRVWPPRPKSRSASPRSGIRCSACGPAGNCTVTAPAGWSGSSWHAAASPGRPCPAWPVRARLRSWPVPARSSSGRSITCLVTPCPTGSTPGPCPGRSSLGGTVIPDPTREPCGFSLPTVATRCRWSGWTAAPRARPSGCRGAARGWSTRTAMASPCSPAPRRRRSSTTHSPVTFARSTES